MGSVDTGLYSQTVSPFVRILYGSLIGNIKVDEHYPSEKGLGQALYQYERKYPTNLIKYQAFSHTYIV